MNLRKVAILLITSLSFATVLPAFTADFQQVEIKGPKNASEEYSGTVYGPIDSSDTLWRIANRYRQNKNLTIYQVMLAIYQLNPTAFEENNINLLRDGFTLRLPSERYIARIDKNEALAKTHHDEARWQSKLPTDSKALVDNLKPTEKLASKTDLDQTKQVLEQRLGAIDEEQNRQFMAIRQQFAESISSVQSILTENQKLFERLDSVNTDLNDLRSGEEQRDQQIGQMGLSIEELLERSRKEDQEKRQAEAEGAGLDWLKDPITLSIVTFMMSLTMLAGFGYWLIGRKKRKESQDEFSSFGNEPPPMPHSSELDDLSDALSNELSQELGSELDDDDFFGDDDLLDDVLSDELEESLDDSIESDLDDFDDFGDEILVPEESGGDLDFESGSDVLEQDDLDSLFDEENYLLAEMDEDIDSIDLSGTDQESDSVEAEIFEDDDLPDDIDELDEDSLFEKPVDIEKKTKPAIKQKNAPSQKDNLTTIDDDQEKPEISIDELLDEQQGTLPEGVEIEDAGQINEEMLQQLDKEIALQGEELDNLTGTLLDELEQVEQMRSMLPDEDESDETEHRDQPDSDHQHDIQKLDELTDGFDDELLSDELSDDAFDMSVDDIEGVADLDLSEQGIDDRAEESGTSSLEELDELVAETEIDEDELASDLIDSAEAEQDVSESETDVIDYQEIDSDDEQIEPDVSESEADVFDYQEIDSDDDLIEPDVSESEPDVSDDKEIDSDDVEIEPDLSESEPEVSDDKEIEGDDDQIEPDLSESEADVSDNKEIDSDDVEMEPEVSESEPDISDDKEIEGDDDQIEPETESETVSAGEEVKDSESIDVDQLDQALEDFEKQSADQVLEHPDTSDEETDPSILSSLEDLEFTESKTSQKPLPDLDNIGSLTDFDDAELEKALWEIDSADDEEYQPRAVSPPFANKELDDMPGLEDWLADPKDKEDSDAVLLDELENSSFDELLETIDIDEDAEGDDDSDLDIEALLSEETASQSSELEESLEEDDFLDVEALLTESIDAESNPLFEKNMDLDMSFGEFSGVSDDSDTVDVDDDHGIGAKLDLAHAYIEIGEVDSAKELLEEIIVNGNPEQVEEAQEVLTNLG